MRRLAWGVALLLAAGPARAAPDDKPDKPAPADEVKTLVADYQKAEQEFYDLLRAAKTPEDQAKAVEKRPKAEPVAARLLELAEQNPKDPGVTPAALVQVVTLPLQGPEGTKLRDKALERLTRDHADSDQLGQIVLSLTYEPSPAAERFLRAVADKNTSDEIKGKATYGLGSLLKQTADTIRYMRKQKDADDRIEAMWGKETAKWLRDADPDRLEKDAEKQFETAADKFAGVKMYDDETVGGLAKGELFEIRNLAIGQTAPDIEADDLDGKPFKLSDYRGKVVVIDFWGNW
jgi:hypothetical protein